MMDLDKINFEKSDGLIPAVVQDSRSFRVLMVGFMNSEALARSLNQKIVTFYSRSKGRLWSKGETSGNRLYVDSIHIDCDQDTLLIMATPTGPVCHTGRRTCFHDDLPRDLRFVGELQRIIEERATGESGEQSYTARLLSEGVRRIAQKVGEEAIESSLAAVAGDKQELLEESADLLYHLLVLLKAKGLDVCDVASVLYDRHK